LTEAEAREVLDAAVPALRYLQSQGLAHAALDPEHVVAVGETIKLSTDALREAATDAPYTDELRAFWYQISPSTLARSADILAEALGGGAAPAPVPAPMPAPLPAAPKPAAATRAAADAPSKPFPKWILVGAAAVVLLILGLNLRRSPEPPAQPNPIPLMPATKAPVPAVTPAVIKPSPLADPSAREAPEPEVPKAREPKAAAREPSGQGMWRVIAFTVRTREDAARRAAEVNRSHPDFSATVFTAREKKALFLVALGGRMSREDALRVQKKARAERVSRDVYVKKFLE
jgi:hypothetical protein